ncbi:CoxG family protein [Haloarchaeobius sp. TZWWS8]|uniref:CoxG family protein n=1 Tax=Haloarchaeobius sp. TZWWS8 TaxID=3446121 RepID=UPI003EBDBB65
MTHSIDDLHVTVTHQFDASARTVWTALSDPAVTREALPAVRSVEPEDGLATDGRGGTELMAGEHTIEEGERYAATIAAPLDRVTAEFDTYVTVAEHRFPNIAGAVGGDGELGSFDARTELAVEETASGCRVEWSVTANVAGDVAAVGEKKLQPVLAREADRYFETLETIVQ